jgi:hypothetical protein
MEGVGFGAAQILGTTGQFASGLLSAQARQAEFAQQIRALKMKRDFTVGIANARAAASGVTSDSLSTTKYMASLTGELNLGIKNLENTAATTDIMDKFSLFSGLVGGGANAYASIGKANNWFMETPAAPAAPPTYTPGSGMPLWR